MVCACAPWKKVEEYPISFKQLNIEGVATDDVGEWMIEVEESLGSPENIAGTASTDFSPFAYALWQQTDLVMSLFKKGV